MYCMIPDPTVVYFGHLVGGGEEVRPLLPKIIALRNYPKPRTRNQLRSFLGLSKYYRKFIRQYADKAKHLHEALNKGEPDQVI